MKRLVLGLVTVGLLLTSIFAQNLKKGAIIESKDELSCSNFGHMQHAVKGIQSSKKYGKYANSFLSGWLSTLDCKNITEGMDLKIIKIKPFDNNYAGYSKGLLVKMPTGMTTWIARL